MNRKSIVLLFFFAASAMALAGCPAAPERCLGCLPKLRDSGIPLPGDAIVATGGSTGTGGVEGTGGSIGTGGSVATGGMMGTGGATGGSGTGGSGTGGAATGGSGTGGVATGGSGTGGAATGGQGTGGLGTGGMAPGGAGAGGGARDPDLVLWYKFDDATGMTVADAAMSGGMTRNGVITTIGTGGSTTFSTMKQVGTHALSLTPSPTLPAMNGCFVALPTGLGALAPAAITISVWVNLAANTPTQNWERIYDFGSTGTLPNMYLTARAMDAPMTPVRFAITTTGNAATQEQRLDGVATLSPNAWHHIVVVLPASTAAGAPYTGRLYVDGTMVAMNAMMTLHMSDVGATMNNWLGKSKFTNPHFNGMLDDFRVYKRALTGAEILTLNGVR